jgi:hypothetical protein
MPRFASKKQLRDRDLKARWAGLPDAVFERIGLTRAQIYAAQDGLKGYIVLPGDPQYDTDRMLFNPVFDPFPAVIVYCKVEADVALAMNVAQGAPYPFTVRAGGHCSAGFSAGPGFLIDVSNLHHVQIDSENLIATVGCGCPFSNLDAALSTLGLHVPMGECEDVCIGGFVQGGGFGFTSTTFGMNCDNVIDMRVMLYDGTIVVASQTVNSDLWWAVRGGTGGNFGVLLSVRYQLRQLGSVFGWAIIWPLQVEQDMVNATDALVALQSGYLGAATDPQMNIQVSLCFQPGTEYSPNPPPIQKPYLLIRGLYVGDEASGQAAIQPLRNLAGAITQWTIQSTFSDLNNRLLNVPYGMPDFPHIGGTPVMPSEDKVSRYVQQPLTAAQYRAILDYYVSTPNPYSYAYFECYGGAIASYPADGNAFIHRQTLFNTVLDVFWYDPAGMGQAEQFLEGWIKLIDSMSNGHAYQNYPRIGEPDYAWAYWGTAANELYAVKCKYDPMHVFSFPQEVMPLDKASGPSVAPTWLQKALQQPIVPERAGRGPT